MIVGTRAITDPEWFADLVRTNRNKIMLALDIRDGKYTNERMERILRTVR